MRGHTWGRLNRVAVPSRSSKHTPLAVAAVSTRCVVHASSRRWVCSPDLPSRCVFARARARACLGDDASLHDEACLRPTCLREASGHPRVFATTRVFARPVLGTRLRAPTCLHDDASLPDLSSGRVLARPRVFTMTHDLARPVFDNCLLILLARTWLHSLARAFRSGCLLFGRPRVFAPRSVFSGNVSSDAHVSSLSSPGMCLLTPRCLRGPCSEASVLDPTCLQNVTSVFVQYVHPPGDRSAYMYT